MSNPGQLITDRTAGDVQRETAKGFYNAADMNRVESAAGELAALLRALPEVLTACGAALGVDWRRDRLGYDPASLALLARTDWTMWDIPDQAEAERYLGNVTAVCQALGVDAAALPCTLDRLTWSGANAIEEGLRRAREAFEALERGEKNRLDRTAQSWPMTGELFAGEMME